MIGYLRSKLRRVLGIGILMDMGVFSVASYFGQALNVVRGLLIAAYLPKAYYGMWRLALIALEYCTQSDGGAVLGMVRQVGVARGGGNDEEALEYARTGFGVTLCAVGVLATATGATSLLFYRLGRYDSALTWGIICALSVLMQGVYFTDYAFIAYKRIQRMAVLRVSFAVVFFASAVPATYYLGLAGLVPSAASAYLVYIFVGFLLAPKGIYRPRLDLSRLRSMWSVGFPMALQGLILTLLMTVDQLLVSHILGLEAMGGYGFVWTMIKSMHLLPVSLGQAVAPRVFEAYGRRDDFRDLLRIIGPSCIGFSWIAAASAGMAYFFAEPLVALVAPKYVEHMDTFRIMLVAWYWWVPQCGAAGAVAAMKEVPAQIRIQLACAASAVLAIIFVLKHTQDLRYVAATTSVIFFIHHLMFFFFVFRRFHRSSLDWLRYLSMTVLPGALAVSCILLVSLIPLPIEGYLAMGVRGILFTSLFALPTLAGLRNLLRRAFRSN